MVCKLGGMLNIHYAQMSRETTICCMLKTEFGAVKGATKFEHKIYTLTYSI